MLNAGCIHESVEQMKAEIKTAAAFRKMGEKDSSRKCWYVVAGYYGINVDSAYSHYRNLVKKEKKNG